LVQHVVHYNVPHNAELFVHRSGRTARANSAGLSLSIIAAKVRRQEFVRRRMSMRCVTA
jgi:ATP-dependent RNA helicase DDX24/MAK5